MARPPQQIPPYTGTGVEKTLNIMLREKSPPPGDPDAHKESSEERAESDRASSDGDAAGGKGAGQVDEARGRAGLAGGGGLWLGGGGGAAMGTGEGVPVGAGGNVAIICWGTTTPPLPSHSCMCIYCTPSG